MVLMCHGFVVQALLGQSVLLYSDTEGLVGLGQQATGLLMRIVPLDVALAQLWIDE